MKRALGSAACLKVTLRSRIISLLRVSLASLNYSTTSFLSVYLLTQFTAIFLRLVLRLQHKAVHSLLPTMDNSTQHGLSIDFELTSAEDAEYAHLVEVSLFTDEDFANVTLFPNTAAGCPSSNQETQKDRGTSSVGNEIRLLVDDDTPLNPLSLQIGRNIEVCVSDVQDGDDAVSGKGKAS